MNNNNEISHYIKASEVKIGDIIIIKGHPCKVVHVAKSKNGKHGQTKMQFLLDDTTTFITVPNNLFILNESADPKHSASSS